MRVDDMEMTNLRASRAAWTRFRAQRVEQECTYIR
jgi:hypothetical protein